MAIDGDGKLQQFLQQSMQVSGFEQVLSARDMSDALECVIVNDAQVIAAADVASDENDIPEEFRGGVLRSAEQIDPFEWLADGSECRAEVEAQSKLISAQDSELSFVGGQAATGTGVEGAFRTVRGSAGSGNFALNILSCAEAGVEESLQLQSFGNLLVVGQVLRLAANGGGPLESQPCEIFENAVCEFFATAGEINVFDAEEELSIGFVSEFFCVQCGAGVSAVEATCGAGCKSAERDAGHSGRVQVQPGQILTAAVWQSRL